MAQQNSQRLLQLTNEILHLNKLEAGKLEVQLSKVVLFNLLKRTIASFQSHAERSEIELLFHYELDKYLQVKLDVKKTETILINLLSNALKYTPVGGQVMVRAKHHEEYLQIIVQDTGKGIHPEDLPHVFDRFFQTTRLERLAEGGTGIGLALSQEFAKLMQGSLRVKSKLDKGSVFTLSLPHIEVMSSLSDEEARLVTKDVFQQKVSENENVIPVEAIKENSIQKDKTILLVEDNYDLRHYIQSLLASFNIEMAENGQVALDYLSTHPKPDLVISDIMMPIMNGYELLNRLKSSETFRSIPIIMLTALAKSDDKLKTLRIGVDDYMVKPFSEEELLARVNNLLQHADWRKHVDQEAVGESTPNIADPPPPELSKTDLDWLELLESTTLEKLGDFDFKVEQLAHEMASSRWQLNRRIKLLTGLTARQYLLEARLNRARLLLEQGEATSVKALTYRVGIKDLQNFSEQFKERFGKSPSEYL